MSSVIINGKTGSGARAKIKAYSSFEPYELEDYLLALSTTLPDVAIEIERMPTAVLTERLLAEHDNLGADFVFGWADTASKTAGLETICLDETGFVRPTGFSTGFIIDPRQVSDCGVESIATWHDLADPRLKGKVVFPDPAISGAGFLALTTLIQFYGESDGWALMDAICQNVATFPTSAWEPAAMTGNGTIAAGVTVRIAATKRASQDAALMAVDPRDVCGGEAEVYGGLRGSRHRDVVSDITQWILSSDARVLFDQHNKTNLLQPIDQLFIVDAARAVADRKNIIERFKISMQK